MTYQTYMPPMKPEGRDAKVYYPVLAHVSLLALATVTQG